MPPPDILKNPDPGDPAGESIHILIVDDDEQVRRLYAAALVRAGFQTVEAASGSDALRVIEAQPIGLVILDVTMPGMSGLEVVARLRGREETARIPILLATGGASDQESVVRGLEAGANDFVAKPVRLGELVARVRAHVRSQEAWTQALANELRVRAGVVAALGHLTVSAVPEEAAATVVRELAERTRSDYISVLQITAGQRLQPLATFTRPAGLRRGGPVLAAHHARDLLGRVAHGPWLETANGQAAGPAHILRTLGLGLAAGVPILANDVPVGLLVTGLLADAFPTSATGRAGFLGAAIDYATILSAVAGAAMADRERTATTRQRLHQVLAEEAFHPVFQPIVAIGTGDVVAYEALTRFNDGTPPATRFAEAGALGLGLDYEVAAAAAALRAADRLPAEAALAINVSPELVLEGDRLRDLLGATKRSIVLELTEHAPVEDYPALRAALEGIGSKVDLAVDDAGAGYASLRHILEVQPTYAKLDISIVRGIEGDALRQALVAGLDYFALRSGCRLIAEGVETRAEAETLTRLGIEMAQGYLFGRPQRY